MESERFEYVGGKKSGSQLIYLISEKQLYKKNLRTKTNYIILVTM